MAAYLGASENHPEILAIRGRVVTLSKEGCQEGLKTGTTLSEKAPASFRAPIMTAPAGPDSPFPHCNGAFTLTTKGVDYLSILL